MTLELLKTFFMWNTVINLGLFTGVALMCIYCRGFIQRIHGEIFGLNEETIHIMLYGFLAFYKIVFIVFVLVPWIALTIIC